MSPNPEPYSSIAIIQETPSSVARSACIDARGQSDERRGRRTQAEIPCRPSRWERRTSLDIDAAQWEEWRLRAEEMSRASAQKILLLSPWNERWTRARVRGDGRRCGVRHAPVAPSLAVERR